MRGINQTEDFGWSNAPRGSGGGGQNTVTQSVQIPAYEQGFSQENQDLARSLASNPYPAYNQPLVQGFADQQLQGMDMAGNAATVYQPNLNDASALTHWAAGPSSVQQSANGALMGATNWADSAIGSAAGDLANVANYGGPNAQNIAGYMSPYIMQSLQPQIQGLQTQLGLEQNAINSQATGANAFGDARQGVEQAAQNYNANQNLANILGTGYNTGFNTAVQTALSEQQQQGALSQALGNLGLNQGQMQIQQGNALGNLGNQLNAQQLGAANQLANIGQLQQQLGIGGANAMFNAGQQQQTLGQQELNQAYQQFLNQANWPYQMLNVRESALSNSPYNMVNATTVPQANMAAQGFGATLSGIGSLGSLLSGNSGSNNAPFGGSAYPSGH